MRRGRFPQACARQALTRHGAEARGGLWTGAWIGSPGSLWWQNARDASTPTAHVAQGARRLSDFACFSNDVRDILLRDTVRPRSQARRAAKGFFDQRRVECAPSRNGVFVCVPKVGETDRQTVLPYLKSADVRMAFEKVDWGVADKRCILLPTLMGVSPCLRAQAGHKKQGEPDFRESG